MEGQRPLSPGRGLPPPLPSVGSPHSPLLHIQQQVAEQGADAEDYGGVPVLWAPVGAPTGAVDERDSHQPPPAGPGRPHGRPDCRHH